MKTMLEQAERKLATPVWWCDRCFAQDQEPETFNIAWGYHVGDVEPCCLCDDDGGDDCATAKVITLSEAIDKLWEANKP